MRTMRNMEFMNKKERDAMEEKLYRTMRGTGATNIVMGVLSLIVGITSGILLIISGAKLLSRKSDILF